MKSLNGSYVFYFSGKHWYKGFITRNPSVSERVPQRLGRERTQVTMSKLEAWYRDCLAFLKEEVPDWEQLLKDPRRLFNCDESGFPLSVTSGRVLAPRGARHVYQVVANTKLQLTVMACMNAIGDYMPPMIVYPGERLRDVGIENYPDAIYGKSANGWMDSPLFATFLDHFSSFVDSKNIPKPVILFVDGHSTHLSQEAAEYCASHSIILYCFLPNASHVCQPCDVGLFSQLKTAWKQQVRQWQMEHLGQILTKKTFSGVFQHAWNMVNNIGNAVGAFKRSGVYPFTINGIDMSKLDPSVTATVQQEVPTAPANTVSTTPVCGSTAVPDMTPTAPVTTICTTSRSTTHCTPMEPLEADEAPMDVTDLNTSSVISLQIPRIHKRIPLISSPMADTPHLFESSLSPVSQPQSAVTPVQSPATPSCSATAKEYVSPSFVRVLQVPNVSINKSTDKLKVKRDILPKALSGRDALAWHAKKEAEKKELEEAKKQRMLERIEKKQHREEEKERKQKERAEKTKERNILKEKKAAEKLFNALLRKEQQQKTTAVDSDESMESQAIPYVDDSDDEFEEDVNPEVCPGCSRAYSRDEADDWVGCDRCPRYWHIYCTNDADLLNVPQEEIEDHPFYCSKC